MGADLKDPMARICWDFVANGVRLMGSVEVRSASGATKTVAALNDEFGAGTHWVEVLSETWAERCGVTPL